MRAGTSPRQPLADFVKASLGKACVLVSQFHLDRRACPACGAEVVSEIWLILHRHERPKLWQQAGSLRTLTCSNGHRGPVRSPLLLFDPAGPIAIFSPGNESDPAHAHAECNYLMALLRDALPASQKNIDLAVQVVPAGFLPFILDSPRMNLGDFAPGMPESDEALLIYAEARSGDCSPARVRQWLDDEDLHPAFRAGLRFELASYLGRAGLDDPPLLEDAISEWRHVFRLYPRARDPRRWAIACLELASCYAKRREASPSANARESLRLLDTALEVLTEDEYPEDFALACARKANLLMDRGSASDLVSQSLTAFQSALSVYSKRSYPDDWALVSSNMATAYLSLGGDSGYDDLRRGIALLDDVLTVRTREDTPEVWAITQMNRGIALSRLPASDGNNPHARAVEALRAAHDVFSELGETAHQVAGAYNLGLTLARSEDPETAEEACHYLEACLPWLLESGRTEQIGDLIHLVSRAYMTLLRSGPQVERGDHVCRRALAFLQKHTESSSAMQAVANIGTWFLQHAHDSPDRLDLALVAFETALRSLHIEDYLELRAGVLANFATVLLLQQRGPPGANRIRARDSLYEALRILRSLPATSQREQQIGSLIMNCVRYGFEPPSLPDQLSG